MNTIGKKQEIQNKAILQKIARGTMILRGLLPDFSAECSLELAKILAPASADGASHVRDLRDLLWASIDNDDSEDLDQLTVAEPLPEGRTMIRVAVADVDALVKKDSAIDRHAQHNTTSIYTAAQIFPMLPLKLSTNLTSLNLNQDRMVVVAEMTIGPDGSLIESDVCRAVVRNHAKLAYDQICKGPKKFTDTQQELGAVFWETRRQCQDASIGCSA
jgi:ribonuclease R